MLTRTSFLALPEERQAGIARRMWANLSNRFGYNPLGGESNDVYMCAFFLGQPVIDQGSFVVWDTGSQVLAVQGADCERHYPLAVRLTAD